MRNEFVDFLNHGLLPLTARDQVVDRIVAIKESFIEREELCSLLVVGEAGSGKSRLIEHLLPKFRAGGGVPLHVKFYPGSPISFAETVHTCLLSSDLFRLLPLFPSEPSLGDLVAGIRRIARLRPTVLLLEDAHLLEGQSLAEVRSTLEMLADESLLILCFSRPGIAPLESLLASSLLETIELRPLVRDDLSELWCSLFGTVPDPQSVDQLLSATHGNPLAVRSALRAGINANAIQVDMAGALGDVLVSDPDSLAAAFERGTHALTAGMVLGLTPEEFSAALQLAPLGEIFSPEGAVELINGGEELIQRLTFKGILAPAIASPRRISGGKTRTTPLAYTHTLLHQHLLQECEPDLLALMKLFVEGVPIYSFLLLDQIRNYRSTGSSEEVSLMVQSIEQAIEIVGDIYSGTDFQRTEDLLALMWTFFEQIQERLDLEDRALLAVKIQATTARMRIKQIYSPSYNELLDELEHLIADHMSEEFALYRFLLVDLRLASWYAQNQTRMPGSLRSEFINCHNELVERYPSLLSSSSYRSFLQRFAQSAWVDEEGMAWVVERFRSVLDSDRLDESAREKLLQDLVPFLLMQFQSSDELEVVKQQLNELKSRGGVQSLPLLFRVILFHEDIGDYDGVRGILNSSLIQRFKDHGFLPQALNLTFLHDRIERAIGGGEPADVIALYSDRINQLPTQYHEPAKRFVAIYSSGTALICGNPETLRELLNKFDSDENLNQTIFLHLTLAIRDGVDPLRDLLHRYNQLFGQGMEEDPILNLAHAIAAGAEVSKELITSIVNLLHTPTISLRRLLQLHPLFSLLKFSATTHPTMYKDLIEDIQYGLREMLDWLERHSLPGFLRPLLDAYGQLLSGKELRRWRATSVNSLNERRSLLTIVDGEKRELSLFGRIEAQVNGGENIEIRGGRLRTLIGVMAALPLLSTPLNHSEFCYLVAGSDNTLDSEKARKTMNAGIFRLRDLLGGEAILTDEEIPRLNPSYLRVDLWRANDLLNHIESTLRIGSLTGLSSLMETVLDIVDGEVLFPSLYEEFFEALREDFEYRLRAILLEFSHRLIREGDLVGCEPLLRRAFITMPEDEELLELLVDLLEKLGKKSEATRLRLRVEPEDVW